MGTLLQLSNSPLAGGNHMKIMIFPILLIVSLCRIDAQRLAEPKSGTVWISPVIFDRKAIEFKNANCCIHGKYSVQVDNGKRYIPQTDSSTCISDLELNKDHVVKIRCNKKVIASFRFSFEKEGSSELCLWHNDLYCTWSLWPLQDAKHLCKCRSAG